MRFEISTNVRYGPIVEIRALLSASRKCRLRGRAIVDRVRSSVAYARLILSKLNVSLSLSSTLLIVQLLSGAAPEWRT
jgi:hypothetical protein